jgi:hypothetical protein
MKEWCMAHPWMTFFIVGGVLQLLTEMVRRVAR